MSTCNPKILVEGSYHNIVQCHHCQRIGFYFQNVLIGFDPEDFFTFTESILNLDFEKHAVLFSDMRERVLIKSCHHDIQLTFTRTEFCELVDMFNQARLLIEAEFYTYHKE